VRSHGLSLEPPGRLLAFSGSICPPTADHRSHCAQLGALGPNSARSLRFRQRPDRGGTGAGSGAITSLILRRLRPGANFIALEIDPLQAKRLRKRFPDLIVCCESAENLGACLARHGCVSADCIVSGLPWGNMSPPVQDRIMGEVVAALRPGGRFCGFGTFTRVGSRLPANSASACWTSSPASGSARSSGVTCPRVRLLLRLGEMTQGAPTFQPRPDPAGERISVRFQRKIANYRLIHTHR